MINLLLRSRKFSTPPAWRFRTIFLLTEVTSSRRLQTVGCGDLAPAAQSGYCVWVYVLTFGGGV